MEGREPTLLITGLKDFCPSQLSYLPEIDSIVGASDSSVCLFSTTNFKRKESPFKWPNGATVDHPVSLDDQVRLVVMLKEEGKSLFQVYDFETGQLFLPLVHQHWPDCEAPLLSLGRRASLMASSSHFWVAKKKYENTGREKGIYYYGFGNQKFKIPRQLLPSLPPRNDSNDEGYGRKCFLGTNGAFALIAESEAYLFQ
jgi:hypothetical protein